MSVGVTGALAASAICAAALDRFVPQPSLRDESARPAIAASVLWRSLTAAKCFMCRAALSCTESITW